MTEKEQHIQGILPFFGKKQAKACWHNHISLYFTIWNHNETTGFPFQYRWILHVISCWNTQCAKSIIGKEKSDFGNFSELMLWWWYMYVEMSDHALTGYISALFKYLQSYGRLKHTTIWDSCSVLMCKNHLCLHNYYIGLNTWHYRTFRHSHTLFPHKKGNKIHPNCYYIALVVQLARSWLLRETFCNFSMF